MILCEVLQHSHFCHALVFLILPFNSVPMLGPLTGAQRVAQEARCAAHVKGGEGGVPCPRAQGGEQED